MKFKEGLLGVAIMILVIFVTFYGINTVFPRPDYDDYCGDFKTQQVIDTQEGCEAIGGMWSDFEGPKPVDREYTGYCERDYTCSQELDEALKSRSQKVFFVALPLGIIIILLGMFVFGIEAVGAGIIGGGIGTLIYGSGAFWPYTENWARFVISLVGLVILVGLVYYFNKHPFGKRKKK